MKLKLALQKKRSAVSAERFVCVSRKQSPIPPAILTNSSCGELGPLLSDFDKLRVARANYTFGVDKAVHVNRDPAAVHENEIGVPDQPEMVRSKFLDEELLRMPAKSKYFTVTRLELLLVHSRFLARSRTRLNLVRVLSATLNIRLSLNVRLFTDVRVRLRSCLRFLFALRWLCRLRFIRPRRRLLRLLSLA
jgi:hypothetical protein